MNDYERFQKIQDDGIKIWQEASKIDFKKEIENLKPTKILYSAKTPKRNNHHMLGVFNYLIELASNVYAVDNIRVNKPDSKEYFEYYFCNNTLKAVKSIDNEHPNTFLYMFIDGNRVYQVGSPHYQLSCLWVVNDNSQSKIGMGGLEYEYLEKIEGNLYKHISCNLYTFIESVYELEDKGGHEVEVISRILKPYDKVIEYHKKYNPFPLPQAVVELLYNQYKGHGIFKLEKEE